MAELTPVAWLELLDGLRGIAALLTVLFYFASTHLTSLITDQHTSPSLVADTPVAILYNGQFAAILFFVLSDMVVSNSAAKTRGAKPQDCGAAACKMTKAAAELWAPHQNLLSKSIPHSDRRWTDLKWN